jgi:hypothetical protein
MGNVIQKLIPMEKNQTLSEYNKVNATKVSFNTVASAFCVILCIALDSKSV